MIIRFFANSIVALITCAVFALVPNHAFALDQTEQFFQDAKSLLKSGNYHAAIQALSQALGFLSINDGYSRTVLLARAQAYYEKGDFKNAWKDLREVLNSQDLSGEALASSLNLKALLNLKEGKLSRAVEDFTQAIDIPHGDNALKSVSLANRGITFLNLGAFGKSISDFDRAIEFDPKSSFNYAARALAHLRTDRVEQARKDSELSMALGPDKQARRIVNSVLNELNFENMGEDCVVSRINEDGQIFVLVKFSNNGRPHRFLLDTGATHSLIDKSLLKELSRETRVGEIGRGTVHLADGSSLPVTKYLIENAFLYNMRLGSIQIQTMDKKTKRSFNLLGAGSLKNLSILIDTSRKRVEIRRKSSTAAQAQNLTPPLR
ncbi:MAG: aspartyl protease family protein [Deltaproteobacteria bacterium]|nr:aspartyl protease family protein [Deltaproteobacteria bacterium]